MALTFAIFFFLLGSCFAVPAGESLVFSLDSLLNADVSLFPGESLTLADKTDASVQNAAAKIHLIVSDPTKLNNAYKTYQMQFKKPAKGSKNVFSIAIEKIMQHNIKARLGQRSYELGVNQFTDLTFAEAASMYTGSIVKNNSTNETAGPPKSLPETRVVSPPSKSWVAEGYVTPVKHQGQCGSCVVFAATAAIESANARCNNHEFLDLSEQEVLDCTDGPGGPTPGNGIYHCNGNVMTDVLNYLKEWGINTLENEDPYQAVYGACELWGQTARPPAATITDWFHVANVASDETIMKDALFNNGPLTASMLINDDLFYYKSGVYSGSCDTGTGHAILLVGYGTDTGMDFWSIKNSWGTTWGEKGYFRIRRGVNQCNITRDVNGVKMC